MNLVPQFRPLLLAGLAGWLIASPAVARPELPDTLATRLAAAPDTARPRLLLAAAAALRSTSPDQAEQAALASRRLARQQHRPISESTALLFLGRMLSQQGRCEEATRYLLKALSISSGQRDSLSMAHAYLYLGMSHKNIQQFEPALRYASQAHRLYERLAQRGVSKAARGAAVALNNSGSTRIEQKDYQAATADLKASLARGRALGDSSVVSMALFNLGSIAILTRQGNEAYRIYRQTLAIDQADGNVQGQAESWLNLGDALALQHRTAAAEAAYQKALALARQVQAGPLLRVVYDGYASLYEDTGRLAEALRWRKRFQQLNDSLFQAESAEQVTEMRTKYEAEQKEAQNRVQAAQLRTQQQVIRRRNTQLAASGAVLLLAGALGWALYKRRRLQQQVELEQQRQRLERQRAAAVLEAEENERRRIGSDLHDGVGQLLTAAKLNLQALERELDGGSIGDEALVAVSAQTLLENALGVVDESFREVRSISHNLLPNALLKRGLAAAVRDFLHKLPSSNGLQINMQAYGLDHVRLDPTVESVLFRVIQELVQNIVKHARATQIVLQLVHNEGELTVMVEDNGVGFAPAALPDDAGIGLRNIETRMAYLGGAAHFDSAPGRGTTVTLEVPLQVPV